MLTEYIQAAMRHAHYEIVENGRFWGDIPPCQGVWAEGETLDGCREELQSVLEDWLLLGFQLGDRIPPVDGIDLNPRRRSGVAGARRTPQKTRRRDVRAHV